MAPTLVTSCTSLPPEGAVAASGAAQRRPADNVDDRVALLDERALSKLKWRCRRGLLENDLLIEKFFARHEKTLTVRQAKGMNDLMELSDNDLLDLLLKRKERETLSDESARSFASTPEAIEVLALLCPAPSVSALTFSAEFTIATP
jgi:antitoxin CptB